MTLYNFPQGYPGPMLVLEIQVHPKLIVYFVQIINEMTKNRLGIHQFDNYYLPQNRHSYHVLALRPLSTFQHLDMATRKYVNLISKIRQFHMEVS